MSNRRVLIARTRLTTNFNRFWEKIKTRTTVLSSVWQNQNRNLQEVHTREGPRPVKSPSLQISYKSTSSPFTKWPDYYTLPDHLRQIALTWHDCDEATGLIQRPSSVHQVCSQFWTRISLEEIDQIKEPCMIPPDSISQPTISPFSRNQTFK